MEHAFRALLPVGEDQEGKARDAHDGADGKVETGAMAGDGDVGGSTVYRVGCEKGQPRGTVVTTEKGGEDERTVHVDSVVTHGSWSADFVSPQKELAQVDWGQKEVCWKCWLIEQFLRRPQHPSYI